jgi:c(7)-type cytochrome triheme protein
MGAERSAHAGLPALGHCLRCHMKQQSPGENPREQQVRDRAAQGGPFRWIQINRNEGHVYFSHAAHVSLAGMQCSDCHGNVRAWTESPRLPDPYLHSMKACMNCHRERGAPNQCAACHR